MFKFCYETRYGDYKDFAEIKPGTVLDIIQDIAIRDSERCGYSLDCLRDLNRAWLMQGINVRFEQPIRTHIPIEAETAVKRFRGVTSERCTRLYQEGEPVAKAVAHWFLFDTEQMRICKIPKEMIEAYEFYDFEDSFFTYQKPEMDETATAMRTIVVSNKEIDTNCHLNNQKGAELLMDALPYDFPIRNISLLYKKTAYLGDELELCRKELPTGYYVHLQTKEKEICVAGIFVTE